MQVAFLILLIFSAACGPANTTEPGFAVSIVVSLPYQFLNGTGYSTALPANLRRQMGSDDGISFSSSGEGFIFCNTIDA